MKIKIESWKNKTESLTKILVAVAVLLGALTFLRIGSFLNASQAMTTAGQVDLSSAGAGDLQKVLAQTKASANEIKKKNLFVPGAARQFPVNQVIGILGHEALIGDKWYRAGDSVGEAKILAVEPTNVRIAWNGQEKVFSPIGAASASGPAGRPERGTLASKKPGVGTPGKVAGSGTRRGSGPQVSGLSNQEKEQRRQRWANMAPDERQRLRDEMQQKPPKRNR